MTPADADYRTWYVRIRTGWFVDFYRVTALANAEPVAVLRMAKDEGEPITAAEYRGVVGLTTFHRRVGAHGVSRMPAEPRPEPTEPTIREAVQLPLLGAP